MHVTISFLLAGHTKFSPDWCFGLAKQKLRRSNIGCLDDLANAITNSAAPNITELVGLEDGTVLVPFYDWVGGPLYGGSSLPRAPLPKDFPDQQAAPLHLHHHQSREGLLEGV